MKRFVLVAALALAALFPPPIDARQSCNGDHLCIVRQERAKVATPIPPDSVVPMLRSIAARLTAEAAGGPFGIAVKTTGENCGGFSCDIICTGQGSAQRQWDVLASSTDPAWNAVDPATQAVRVCVFSSTPPPPPPPDLEPLIAALRLQVAQLTDAVAVKDRRIVELETEVGNGGASTGLILAAIAAVPAHQIPPDVADRIKDLTAAVNQERIVVFKLFGQNVTAVIKEGKK